MKDLKGKVAVITGGASGVGLQLALRLARAGAKIVLADIEENALHSALEEVRATGAEAITQRCDVVKRADVDALRDRAFEHFGKVHLLFNNAGVTANPLIPLWEIPAESWRWTMDVNFFGPLNGIMSFLPKMIAQDEEALVAATCSTVGIVYPAYSPAYNASKAALLALMETLCHQVKDTRVRAAVLFPGPHVVDTRLFDAKRNLQSDYDGDAVPESAVKTVAEFKAGVSAMVGHDVPITPPDEFAEEVYQSILRDEFYILPMTEQTKDTIRERFEHILRREQPVEPPLF